MKYYLFLLLVVIFSIPFYLWGVISPVAGLPFGLPISFLMIFVPFFLSITYAWIENRGTGVLHLFRSIFDMRKARTWVAIFCLICMPASLLLSYFTMVLFSVPLPDEIVIPFRQIPLMLLLYFLGAIPEEFGWTMTVTEPLTKRHGSIGAGALIGFGWALWHVIPWSWAHDVGWIAGMILMNIFMRIGMVYAFTNGGASLFYAVVFHAMINVSMGVFPNSGSHTNPWVISIWLLAFLVITHFFLKRAAVKSATHLENRAAES